MSTSTEAEGGRVIAGRRLVAKQKCRIAELESQATATQPLALIWSTKHGAWWGPKCSGHNLDLPGSGHVHDILAARCHPLEDARQFERVTRGGVVARPLSEMGSEIDEHIAKARRLRAKMDERIVQLQALADRAV